MTETLTRRVGQPGGGTDLTADEQKRHKGGDRLSPGADARIYPWRGGVADRSHCTIVRIPEKGGEVTIRQLDPGDYVAMDEEGHERKFSVTAGVEEAIIQPGKGHHTTGPGGAIVQEIDTPDNAPGQPVGEPAQEQVEAAQKPVKPAAAARENAAKPKPAAPTRRPRNDPNKVATGAKLSGTTITPAARATKKSKAAKK